MNYQVLICEDDKEIHVWLTDRLKNWGLSVTGAFTGLEAVSLAGFAPPDLILLDMLLPDVDGMAVLRKLSIEPKTAAVPIIALAPTEWIAERLTEVPIAGVIRKPISEQILENTVRGIFRDLERKNSLTDSVLVFDDKREVFKAVEACLGSMGVRALCASDEKTAEQALSDPALQAAIIVLRSASAPFQQILRRIIARKPAVPIVAITDRLETQEVQSLSASGIHAILVQPFSAARLTGAVKEALHRSGEDANAATPKRVLLVEDAALAAKVMGSLLEHAGYRVTHAANAEKALQLLRQQQPEFMLLDVILPGMDGVEFVHQIQQSDLHIPFAVVTGIHDPRRMSALQSMGALRVFEKPIHSDDLLGFMDNYFSQHEQSAAR